MTRGHKKKARTRRLLLDTARDVLAEHGEGFSVADIAARAGVSHGTFYNYFADRDALLAELVLDIVGSFAVESAVAVDETDPVMRIATISARALRRATDQPEVVRVALRVESAQQALLADGPFAHLRHDLAAAHSAGRLADPPDEATVDVVAGSLLLAARRIVDGETDAGYRQAVVRRVLLALGVSSTEAASVASAAVRSAS